MTMFLREETIKKMHCGVFHAPKEATILLMPELEPIINLSPVPNNYTWDVKVHMLMPGQFPCIPNWHYDFTPRDSEGEKEEWRRDRRHRMFMWVSGPPYTIFRDGPVGCQKWKEFSQFDEHTGAPAEEHGWRVFIRAVPTDLCSVAPSSQWLRRHSQVYLDAARYEW